MRAFADVIQFVTVSTVARVVVGTKDLSVRSDDQVDTPVRPGVHAPAVHFERTAIGIRIATMWLEKRSRRPPLASPD